ncbi:hypothetical protein OROGR_008621 [Orobanche gracilis]
MVGVIANCDGVRTSFPRLSVENEPCGEDDRGFEGSG